MEVFVMTHVIVPGNFADILQNPAISPDVAQELVEQIQAKTHDTLIILGQKSFLYLLTSECDHIYIYLDFDIHNTDLGDATRLAAYLLRFNLPPDTRTLNFITRDTDIHNKQEQQYAKRFLQTVAYHLGKQHHHPRITHHGQLIEAPRFMQQPSRIFGFFVSAVNRYGNPQKQFVNASPEMSQPEDIADQTPSSPKPKSH
jgi:hypothetical protein